MNIQQFLEGENRKTLRFVTMLVRGRFTDIRNFMGKELEG